MNWRIILGVLLVAALAGLVVLQRRQATTAITPRPLLTLVADTERQLERLPLELTRVSEQDENAIGQNLARQYALTTARQHGDAMLIATAVSRVGERVAANVKRKGIRYRFYYQDDPSLANAFAMPGGQIVFGRGLLETLETEDELAAILGHEMAHVDERHCIEHLQYELRSRKLGLGGLYRLGRPAVMIFEAGYSKEKEAEADRAGAALAVAAGYSPAGAVSVLRRFERYESLGRQPASALDEMLTITARSLQEYFRSHPPARERIATVEKEISAHGWDASQPQQPLKLRAIFVTEAARQLERRGLYDRAIARYQEALRVNPDYLPALTELAWAEWQKGDSGGAATSAREVLLRKPDEIEFWHLFACALASANRVEAPISYRKLAKELEAKLKPETRLSIEVDSAGLDLYRGQGGAISAYRGIDLSKLNAPAEAERRRAMAWWMYRSGLHAEAVQELLTARQRYPQSGQTDIDLAWIYSEMGRQADARELSSRVQEEDEVYAVRSVIEWRTDQRDSASASFRQAVERNATWMEPKWVLNTFSRPTVQTLGELQKAELARREREAAERAGKIPPGGRKTR